MFKKSLKNGMLLAFIMFIAFIGIAIHDFLANNLAEGLIGLAFGLGIVSFSLLLGKYNAVFSVFVLVAIPSAIAGSWGVTAFFLVLGGFATLAIPRDLYG